jgi:glutaredoxin 3
MAGTITVYTKTACPYCEIVKKFLDMKGASYKTINMDEDLDAMQEVFSMTGKAIGPTTIIEKADGSKDVIVGLNLSRIAPAIA